MLVKRRSLRAALLIVFLATAIPAHVLRGQDSGRGASPPDTRAKQLMESVCVQCHALGTVTEKKKTSQEWERTIGEMISRGAQVSADDAKIIAGYLGEHFGPDRQASAQSAGTSEGAASLPDAPGKELLMSKCFQCHGDGMWKTLRQNKKAWEATIYPMVGRGALWTEQEISTMAQYLETVLGPKEDATQSTGGRK